MERIERQQIGRQQEECGFQDPKARVWVLTPVGFDPEGNRQKFLFPVLSTDYATQAAARGEGILIQGTPTRVKEEVSGLGLGEKGTTIQEAIDDFTAKSTEALALMENLPSVLAVSAEPNSPQLNPPGCEIEIPKRAHSVILGTVLHREKCTLEAWFTEPVVYTQITNGEVCATRLEGVFGGGRGRQHGTFDFASLAETAEINSPDGFKARLLAYQSGRWDQAPVPGEGDNGSDWYNLVCVFETPTETVTFTLTPTPTATNTPEATLISSPTATPSPTRTWTLTVTRTPTETATITQTVSPTATEIETPLPTNTPTPTITQTYTLTVTPTPTESPTVTATESPPPSATPTATKTATTPSPTFTVTATPVPPAETPVTPELPQEGKTNIIACPVETTPGKADVNIVASEGLQIIDSQGNIRPLGDLEREAEEKGLFFDFVAANPGEAEFGVAGVPTPPEKSNGFYRVQIIVAKKAEVGDHYVPRAEFTRRDVLIPPGKPSGDPNQVKDGERWSIDNYLKVFRLEDFTSIQIEFFGHWGNHPQALEGKVLHFIHEKDDQQVILKLGKDVVAIVHQQGTSNWAACQPFLPVTGGERSSLYAASEEPSANIQLPQSGDIITAGVLTIGALTSFAGARLRRNRREAQSQRTVLAKDQSLGKALGDLKNRIDKINSQGLLEVVFSSRQTRRAFYETALTSLTEEVGHHRMEEAVRTIWNVVKNEEGPDAEIIRRTCASWWASQAKR